ncbi:unnamed protein product [Arabidopsis halleri]
MVGRLLPGVVGSFSNVGQFSLRHRWLRSTVWLAFVPGQGPIMLFVSLSGVLSGFVTAISLSYF